MTPERRAELKRLKDSGEWLDAAEAASELLAEVERLEVRNRALRCERKGAYESRNSYRDECRDLKSEVAIMAEAVDAAIADRKAVESERDALKAEVERLQGRLRLTAQRLVEGFGSNGPENAEDAALRACAAVEKLRGELEKYRVGNVLARVAELEGALRATTEGRDRFAEQVRSMESALQTAVSCFDIRLLVTAEQWTAMEAKCRAALAGKEGG